MTTHDPSVERCDFCRQAIIEPISFEGDNSSRCCTAACRDALQKTERVFTDHQDQRQFVPGIAGIDDSLPQGFPRNSFVFLIGHAGTREEAIQAELVWRTLEREEPAIVVAFTEPPISVVENFLAMDWNVLPFLESGQLHILDCFTYRVDDRNRLFDRMTRWNQHVRSITDPATTAVRDPTDGHELRNTLDNCLERLEMVETGVVIIDSLVEYGSLVQPVRAYDLVKDARAEICKGRFVPIVAGATMAGDEETFPRDLEYVADGIVDLEFDGTLVEDTLFRRLRVRKMRGVLTISEWHTYEYTSGLGLVTFDPREEADADKPEAQSDHKQDRTESKRSGDDSGDREGE